MLYQVLSLLLTSFVTEFPTIKLLEPQGIHPKEKIMVFLDCYCFRHDDRNS